MEAPHQGRPASWIRPTAGRGLDVLVAEGSIAKVGKHLKAPEGTEIVNARASRLPGPDRHPRPSPGAGLEYKETIAAARGARGGRGFTAVACMAIPSPVQRQPLRSRTTSSPSARRRRRARVPDRRRHARPQGRGAREMAELAEAGCVAFSDDGKVRH